MKKYIVITTLTLLALLVGLSTRKADSDSAEKSYPVDPIIGTGGHGHVFVGANVPHGMISVGPNNASSTGNSNGNATGDAAFRVIGGKVYLAGYAPGSGIRVVELK